MATKSPEAGHKSAEFDRKAPWDDIDTIKGDTGVSWYQREPRLSLELIGTVSPSQCGQIIDVGGGYGAILAEILLANPQLHGVLFDIATEGLDRPLHGFADSTLRRLRLRRVKLHPEPHDGAVRRRPRLGRALRGDLGRHRFARCSPSARDWRISSSP